jgi:hypothetical protein
VGDLADLPHRVHGPRVDVAELGAHDRRPAPLLQRRRQRRRPHAALVVGVHRLDGGGAHAQEAQRPVDGAVAALAGQHPHPRRPPQPGRLQVPAGPAQHLAQGDGQPGEVGHLGAGDQTHRHPGGQAEQLGQPGPGHLLDHAGRRAEHVEGGVLVPGRGEPVGGQGRRAGAADHEPEVAAAAGRDHARFGGGGQLGHHLAGVQRPLRQRPPRAARSSARPARLGTGRAGRPSR